MVRNLLTILVCIMLWKDVRTELQKPCSGLGCPSTSVIEKVSMKKLCGKTYSLDNLKPAISLLPTEHTWNPITPCSSCSVTIETNVKHHHISAIFYSLGLAPRTGRTCSTVRLDLYDGSNTTNADRLSDPDGICGKQLPRTTFSSTNDSLTVKLTSACHDTKLKINPYEFGTFEVIVAAVKTDVNVCPGEFQCLNRDCIDKTLVCDGHSDCTDASDELGCPGDRKVLPVWAVVLLILIAMATIIIACYILYILFVSCCLCCSRNGYHKV